MPHGETITVQRPAGTDRYGQPLPGTSHTIPGCGWAPRAAATFGARSTEEHFQTAQVSTDRVLYPPYGADIGPQDEVIFGDGTRWQVEGDPSSWRSPLTGHAPGMEVTLRRVSG